jgi:hypothetical protein
MRATAMRWSLISSLAGLALCVAATSRASAQTFASTTTASKMRLVGNVAQTPAITPAVVTSIVRTPLTVPSVAAQAVNPNLLIAPGLTLPQASFNTAVLGQALRQIPPAAFAANQLGALNAGAVSPFGGGLGSSLSPYGSQGTAGSYPGYSGYPEDPSAGYLRGASTLTNADGQYLSQVQQARLLQSQADTAKLELRHRIAEQAALDRKGWLDPETERIKGIQASYERATRDPPISEVLSGHALNELYNHAAYPFQEKWKLPAAAVPDIPLDDELLKRINLVGAGSSGSVGLFKDRGRLSWPLVLQAPAYDAARTNLTVLVSDAVDQLRLNNPVSAANLRDMNADVRRMNEALLRSAGEVSPSEYIEARRYLGNLESAIKALQDPDAGNQLNQNWLAHARNVAELVDFMAQKGLHFGPAGSGDEPAYKTLYQRLLAYDSGVMAMLSSAKAPSASK